MPYTILNVAIDVFVFLLIVACFTSRDVRTRVWELVEAVEFEIKRLLNK